MKNAAVILLALALAPAASAQEPAAPPVTRELRASLGGSLGPAGLQNGFDLSWRRALSRSHSLLLSDAHLAAGFSTRLTPAYARLGPWVELAPLSILEVRAGVEGIGYFGTFHTLLPYQGYDDPFDDDTRNARDGARPGTGARAYVAPALQARVGRVSFRGRAELEWWTLNGPGPFFYEPSRDTLLRSSGDRLVALETLLLWSAWDDDHGRLLVGPLHELLLVYDAARNRRQAVGLLAVWGLGPRRLGVSDPVVLAKVARYFEDPNRQGRLTVQVGLGIRLSRSR